jgi:glycosyltransferase involved in cell wall biosynthesis
MSPRSLPLVSVVTPVYNNAEHFAECIESVLAQSYQNWDYTIVNNCCTDGSAEIARRYAAKNPRIRIHDNAHFLRAISNHNLALRQISPESKYCKIVFADDWIFPQCLEQMVSVAEEHPSVGIVGAYGLQEVGAGASRKHEVVWTGMSFPDNLFSGREVCRRLFLEKTYVFGTATSLLYRADLVRSRDAFYNESNLHADMEVCVLLLKTCDFGFAHQILTFKRWRPESLGTLTADLYTTIAGHLYNLVTHGPDFLTKEEFEGLLHRRVAEYYNFLGVSFMRGRRDEKFWEYHKIKLAEAVGGFSRVRLARAILWRLCKALVSPYETSAKLREMWD